MLKKIVLTGAAGRLGSHLRAPLLNLATELVSTDIVEDIGAIHPGERYVQADVADLVAMENLLEGADMVVHFGAIVDEAPFETLLGPNFIGAYNVWEAAYRKGVRRVVYASSIHAVGMHSRTEVIGVDAPHRPDTFYGLAKCFAEDLASMYWDKRGVESVCLRILSCTTVSNARAVGTWLSYDDLVQLVEKSVTAPITKFTVVYGVSNNDRAPVDNSGAAHLGYRPKDNAEQFAGEFLNTGTHADLSDPAVLHQGGPFAAIALGDRVMASMNLVEDEETS